MTPGKRFEGIDIAKGLAILGVVGIHLLGAWEQYIPYQEFISGREKYLFLDQLLRFCVPLFVACSGFVLAAKYSNLKVDPREYFRKRIVRLLPLYVFWIAVIWFVVKLSPAWQGYISGQSWREIIFLGRADYHLYFVPMIVQLYILFPGILYLMKKFGAKVLLMVLIMEAGFLYWMGSKISGSMWGGFWSDQEQYVLAASWFFYFADGAYFGVNFALGKIVTKSRLMWASGAVLAFGGLAWSFFDARAAIVGGKDILVATRFTRLPILIYGAGILTVALSGWEAGKENLFNPVKVLFVWLGRHSYSIFLGHTLLVRILFSYLKADVPGNILMLALVGVAAAFVVSFQVEGR